MSTQSRLEGLARWALEQGREPARYEYGPAEDQCADLCSAERGGTGRVAVLIHGGFWRSAFDRRTLDALANALADRGWTSWNIEYRRGAGAGVRALDDVDRAIAHLGELMSISELVVIGHSAGGQLALCTAGRRPAALTVSLAGVTDMFTAAAEHIGDDAVAEFLGADPEQAPELYRALDPLGRIPTGAQTLLVHGDADDRVPIAQSRLYGAAAAGRDACELLELPGADHFDLIDPRTAACRTWMDRLPS